MGKRYLSLQVSASFLPSLYRRQPSLIDDSIFFNTKNVITECFNVFYDYSFFLSNWDGVYDADESRYRTKLRMIAVLVKESPPRLWRKSLI